MTAPAFTLAPLMGASAAIQIHVAAVLIAVAATLAILPLAKGTVLHRRMGRVWVVAMLIAAIVSFGINESGSRWGVSWIHIFSVIVLVNVPYAIWAIRRGNVAGHKSAMLGVAFGGLGIAGFFALQRGRLMFDVLWGA